jgi:hypothetical protein
MRALANHFALFAKTSGEQFPNRRPLLQQRDRPILSIRNRCIVIDPQNAVDACQEISRRQRPIRRLATVPRG